MTDATYDICNIWYTETLPKKTCSSKLWLWIRQLTYELIHRYEIWQMRHMMHVPYDILHNKTFPLKLLVWNLNEYLKKKFDITKYSTKKHVLQKCGFLFCMKGKFNYLQRKLLICHYFSRNRVFIQVKTWHKTPSYNKFLKKFPKKFLQNYVFLNE